MKTLQEYLIDALRSTTLYEMAERQTECERTVKNQCTNIAENLVLLNYFKISGLPTTNINHWKNELGTAISNASDFKMKKDHSIGRRQRIVATAFNERDMVDYDVILKRVKRKFSKESETQYPSMNSIRWLDEAIIASINQMPDIQELIVSGDDTIIDKWIDKF